MGLPGELTALRKKRLAAAVSRLSVSESRSFDRSGPPPGTDTYLCPSPLYVDAGIKGQHFRRLRSQRKTGHRPGRSTHAIRDSKFSLARYRWRDYYQASAKGLRFLVDGTAAGTTCSLYG